MESRHDGGANIGDARTMTMHEKEIRQIDAAIEKAKHTLALEPGGTIELPVGFGVLDDTREYQLRIVVDCNEAWWMRPLKKTR